MFTCTNPTQPYQDPPLPSLSSSFFCLFSFTKTLINTTHPPHPSNRYAFNAWIPLITYNTTYAPRFLAGNTTTVGLIVCAALTLTLAVVLQKRDDDEAAAASEASHEGTSDSLVRAERIVVGPPDDGTKHATVVVGGSA